MPPLTCLRRAWLVLAAASAAALPAQVAPPADESKPEWERAVVAEADRFLASDHFRRQHTDPQFSFAATGASRILHPRLAQALPDHRFYFAHVREHRIERQQGKDVESFSVHVHLAVVAIDTGRARLADRGHDTQGEWGFDAVTFLDERARRPRSLAEVDPWRETFEVLERIAAGACQPCTQDRPMADAQWIDRQFGLGMPTPLAAKPRGLPSRTVASATHWFVVYPSARCDDWDLPVRAEFELLRIPRDADQKAIVEHEKGKVWQSHEHSDAALAAEIDRFCAELERRP